MKPNRGKTHTNYIISNKALQTTYLTTKDNDFNTFHDQYSLFFSSAALAYKEINKNAPPPPSLLQMDTT